LSKSIYARIKIAAIYLKLKTKALLNVAQQNRGPRRFDGS